MLSSKAKHEDILNVISSEGRASRSMDQRPYLGEPPAIQVHQ
jgi:hypothetical protein